MADPDDPVFDLKRAAAAHVERGQIAAALATYRDAVQRAPTDAALAGCLASLALDSDKVQLAEQFFNSLSPHVDFECALTVLRPRFAHFFFRHYLCDAKRSIARSVTSAASAP